MKNTEEQRGARKPLESGAASTVSVLLTARLLFSPSRLSGKPHPLCISSLIALAASWFGLVMRPCNPALPPRPFQLYSHQLLPYHLRLFWFRFQLEGTCVVWLLLSCQAEPELATQPGMRCLWSGPFPHSRAVQGPAGRPQGWGGLGRHPVDHAQPLTFRVSFPPHSRGG